MIYISHTHTHTADVQPIFGKMHIYIYIYISSVADQPATAQRMHMNQMPNHFLIIWLLIIDA